MFRTGVQGSSSSSGHNMMRCFAALQCAAVSRLLILLLLHQPVAATSCRVGGAEPALEPHRRQCQYSAKDHTAHCHRPGLPVRQRDLRSGRRWCWRHRCRGWRRRRRRGGGWWRWPDVSEHGAAEEPRQCEHAFVGVKVRHLTCGKRKTQPRSINSRVGAAPWRPGPCNMAGGQRTSLSCTANSCCADTSLKNGFSPALVCVM